MQKQTAKTNTDLKSKTNNNIRKKQLHKAKVATPSDAAHIAPIKSIKY